MRKRRLRLGVAIGLVAMSLVFVRAARADEDNAAPKCDCYIPFLGHGTWGINPTGEFPPMVCGKTDCWVPLLND